MKKLFTILVLLVAMNANGQWIQTTDIYGGTVYALAASGVNLFAGTMGNGVHLSTNNGNNWAAVNNGLGSTFIRCLIFSGGNLFAGCSGVYLSTNNGTNWTAVNNGLTSTAISSLASSGINLFAGTNIGVFLSTNNGANWTILNNGIPVREIVSLAVSGANVFAGTSDDGVYYSSNSGASWTLASNGLGMAIVINALAISGTNIFAGENGEGVFLSTNNGANWTAVNSGLTNKNVKALIVSGTNLFAATFGGIFLSTNNGTNWIAKNQGISPMQVFFCFALKDNYIFTGAQYGSIWRRLISEIIGISNISTEIPLAYSLSQNYPNPFNPTTKIKFDVAIVKQASLLVTLKVYDITGSEVQTLVNERLQPGTYEATFNGSALNSGVYFYRMETSSFVETKKMLFLK